MHLNSPDLAVLYGHLLNYVYESNVSSIPLDTKITKLRNPEQIVATTLIYCMLPTCELT